MNQENELLRQTWTRAGGICAFPGCGEFLQDKTQQEFHRFLFPIKREAPGGDGQYILLCKEHQAVVKREAGTYTPDRLLEMKLSHEAGVYSSLNNGHPWQAAIARLLYLHVPRLAIYAQNQGYVMRVESFMRKPLYPPWTFN